MTSMPPGPPDLLLAVQAGLRQQALERALWAAVNLPPPHVPAPDPPAPDVPPEPPAPPPAVVPPGARLQHLLRRAGRRGLRLARPLALPLLHRFEWRVRTAVDKSDLATGTAAGLADLRRAQAELREAIGRLDAGLGSRLDSLLQRHIVPLGDHEYLVRCDAGWLVVPASDERLVVALIEGRGVLERGTTAVLEALLRPGDTMLDIGAHIGTLTLPCARAVGPHGRVIAVEPGAQTLAMLRRSLHISSLAERVDLHGCAAGAAPCRATLHRQPVLGESSLLPIGGTVADEIVDVRPVDDLVPRGRDVAVVKIDVEGYEPEVWRGMRRVLDDNPGLAAVVEFGASHLRRAGTAPQDWLRPFREDGFTPWEIDEATATLRPLRATGLDEVYSMNLLMLRRPVAAWPRLVPA